MLDAQNVFLDFVDVSDAADFALDTNNPAQNIVYRLTILFLRSHECKNLNQPANT